MKTKINLLKTTLVLGFISLSIMAVSNNLPTISKGKKLNETEKTIGRYFKFPSVLIPRLNSFNDQIQKVEVLFTTNKDGKVNFALAKTNNLELKKEIEKQL